MEKTIKDLAQEVINVQDACNITAVVNGFARAITHLRMLQVLSTDDLCAHPIVTLWADKISSLTNTQSLGNATTMEAYDKVLSMLDS